MPNKLDDFVQRREHGRNAVIAFRIKIKKAPGRSGPRGAKDSLLFFRERLDRPMAWIQIIPKRSGFLAVFASRSADAKHPDADSVTCFVMSVLRTVFACSANSSSCNRRHSF